MIDNVILMVSSRSRICGRQGHEDHEQQRDQRHGKEHPAAVMQPGEEGNFCDCDCHPWLRCTGILPVPPSEFRSRASSPRDFAAQLIYVRQNFCNSGIKLFGDFLSDIDHFIQCPGQRLAFENRHAVFDRDLANLHRQIPLPFGNDARRMHRVGVVFDRDRKLRRIRHDHVRLGNVLLKPLRHHLDRDLSAAAFDLGIAVHRLHFVFHFLLGHLQRLFDFVSLIEIIDDGQDQQQEW